MRPLRIFLSTIYLGVLQLNGQSVIINEFSQGSDGGKEWVELLVISDGVDLRGWELGDNDDGAWDGIAELSDHTDWSSLPSGTLIVLFNSGDVDATIVEAGGEDTDYGDKVVLIGIDNTTYLTDTGAWGSTSGAFANSDGDDVPAIRDAGDNIIHDMAVTHPSATVPGPGSGQVKYYTGNTVEGITDDANWVEAASSSGTPGELNGGDNSNWADQSLPVELSEWFAATYSDRVELHWTTESELENQGFLLERGTPPVEIACPAEAGQRRRVETYGDYTVIATFTTHANLIGHGSTTTESNYSFTDHHVESGYTYLYRLSDVDYQGNTHEHPELKVTIPQASPSKTVDLQIHPNPSNSDVVITVELPAANQPLKMDIYDLRGKRIRQLYSGTPSSRTLTKAWDGLDDANISVASGTYIVKVHGAGISGVKSVTWVQ